jgi:hypothetical protein
MVYGRWTSYTYMKQNYETSCNCFGCGGEGVEGERQLYIVNVQCKSNPYCHYESLPIMNIS